MTLRTIITALAASLALIAVLKNRLRLFLIGSVILLPLVASGCVDKIAQFEEVLSRVQSGDEDWVRANASSYFELRYPDDAREKGIRTREALANISEDIAVVALTTGDRKVKNAALLALLKNTNLTSQRGGKTWINFRYTSRTWRRLSADEQVQIFDLMGAAFEIEYDTNNQEFLKDELCEAVAQGDVQYTLALIRVASFDPGFLRCVRGFNNSRRIAYNPEAPERCPMSLRRIAGANYGSAFRSKSREIVRRLEAGEDAFSANRRPISSIENARLMNSLLDSYDKWSAGGDCTPDTLLKPGVELPEGF